MIIYGSPFSQWGRIIVVIVTFYCDNFIYISQFWKLSLKLITFFFNPVVKAGFDIYYFFALFYLIAFKCSFCSIIIIIKIVIKRTTFKFNLI